MSTIAARVTQHNLASFLLAFYPHFDSGINHDLGQMYTLTIWIHEAICEVFEHPFGFKMEHILPLLRIVQNVQFAAYHSQGGEALYKLMQEVQKLEIRRGIRRDFNSASLRRCRTAFVDLCFTHGEFYRKCITGNEYLPRIRFSGRLAGPDRENGRKSIRHHFMGDSLPVPNLCTIEEQENDKLELYMSWYDETSLGRKAPWAWAGE
ncbi:hypothetical protein T440DRAFT_482782 [Plenodomus tracheiphilus IPT5]|uniref:Uncharacterized protein n=1 Tax=Plenodomus tracheiphilus IPT5 TaxID=1408161 RepID=A0A6A7AT33_9PLEO|nr:hypothetical protein T440DRAFT_482782 [Plenodomus tracheiphilus IPT5]